MSLYRDVHIQVWSDAKFLSLSDDAKLLFLYFLTGDTTSPIPGVVISGRAALAEKMRWTKRKFDRAFTEIEANRMAEADWSAGLVWLPNGAKHRPPANPNVIMSWRNYWSIVPECSMKAGIYDALRQSMEPRGEAFATAFRKAIERPTVETVSGTVSGTVRQTVSQTVSGTTPSGVLRPLPETGSGSGSGSGGGSDPDPECARVEPDAAPDREPDTPPILAPHVPTGPAAVAVIRERREYRMAVVGAATPPFLSVWERYCRQDRQQDAAQEWQYQAIGFPGGEAGLAAAILAKFDAGQLNHHPYSSEYRYRPMLRTYLEGQRWNDELPTSTKKTAEQLVQDSRLGWL